MRIRKTKNNGCDVWMVDYGLVDGKRRREFFQTEGAANDAGGAFEKDRKEVGKSWATIPARNRREIVRILGEIDAAGATLAEVWKAYQVKPISTDMTLGKAIDLLLASRKSANRRETYLTSLTQYLKTFRDKVGANQPIALITKETIENFLNEHNTSQWARQTWQSRISTLFRYAVAQEYIEKNPCKKLDAVTIDHQTPAILSVRAADLVLKVAARHTPEVVPYLVLGMFCGIRPDELMRLPWAAVDLKQKHVILDAGITKTRARRIVPISPNAVAWLKAHAKDSGLVSPPRSTLRDRLQAIRRYFRQATTPQDILRHSAASYLLAREQDVGRVAAWLGNSAGVLLKNYKALVTRKQAQEFFSILPSSKQIKLKKPLSLKQIRFARKRAMECAAKQLPGAALKSAPAKPGAQPPPPHKSVSVPA